MTMTFLPVALARSKAWSALAIEGVRAGSRHPGEGGQAAGDRDFAFDVAGLRPVVVLDRLAEAFGGDQHVFGVFGIGLAGRFVIAVDDGEFVAADTGDEIVRAGAGAEKFNEYADNGIAGGVAELVVVFFEIVDIEE